MTDDDGAERLLTGYEGRLLLTASVGWAVLQGGRLLVSPLLPTIKADLVISNAQAGFAFTVLWGVYALLQFPSGRLSDVLSRKLLLVAGLLLAAVGFALLTNASGYPLFILGALVVGVGVGFYPTPARGLLSDLFVKRRGAAFGLHTASGDVGGVLAAGLATLVLAVAATWRVAFWPVVVILLLTAVGLHYWSREPYGLGWADLAVADTVRRLLANPRIRWFLVAYTLFGFTWQATTAFLPTFLQAEKAFPPAIANAGFAAFFVVGASVKPVSGWLGDRYRRSRVAPAVIALGALALVGVLLAESILIVGIGVVVFAAGLMAFPPVMQSYLMDNFPTDSMAGDFGGMRSIYVLLGSAGPTIVGAVADAADLTLAFTGLVVLMATCSAILVWVNR